MRPTKLTMKAFGSFARETAIDFDRFKSGLYLIVGDTGAGKTTIFDAISFALFGAASGTGRRPDMMHSDYVEKSQDTLVCLSFTHTGREYTVRRSIHFSKKRGEDQYGDGKLDAELISPEGSVIKGHVAVTRRCEELLGLNADQFRKIVMLAQGEFKEFLTADAARKSDILSRLFDSSLYVRYQKLLDAARDSLAQRRRGYTESLNRAMGDFQPPSDDPEENIKYLPGNPELTANLHRLLEEDRAALAELDGEKLRAQKAVEELNRRKGAAIGDNALISELAEKEVQQRELLERQAEMELLRAQCDRADRALHRVLPFRDRWETARDLVVQTRQDLEGLRSRLRSLHKAHETAKAALEADEPERDRLSRISAEIEKTTRDLPAYDALEEIINSVSALTESAANEKAKLGRAQERESDLQGLRKTHREELAGLEDADGREALANVEYLRAKERCEAFEELSARIAEITGDLSRLQAKKASLAAAAHEALKAEERHHSLYQLFISGQAGLMAADLEAELNEKGAARCPVCNSPFCRGQEHSFARVLEGTPSQAQVDSARQSADALEKRRREAENSAQLLESGIEARKVSALERAGELLPHGPGWEDLADGAYMENARGELLSAREEAESAWRAALARKERRAKLQAQLSEREKALEALAGEIAQHRSDVSRKETELASLNSEISTLQAALPFPGRRAARDHIDALISQRDSISALIAGHENEERAAAEALSKARGQEESLEKALPDRERAEKEAAAALEAALTSSGLASRAGLDAALAPLGDGDRESRLKALQAECTEYDHNCKAVFQRISELAEQTRDLTYTDMEALEAQLNEAREGRTQAENAHAHRQSLLTNHEAVLNRALSALSSLARTDCAFRRISALADLAVGTAAQGGKLSFERYVMGSIFRAVLEMANRRLDIMSGGRYSLVHTVNAARSNSVAGLEIEVLDASTGRRRGAASLSGGETFQVSLALALGLSDVVQTRSGGMGLDTIFIDEGFGALDGTALDNAITVLRNLTERSRLVGIISHVDKLEESIPQKLRVKKGTQGSTVTSELS